VVPVIDFHTYRGFLKKSIIQRFDRIVVDEDPYDYAWLVYAFAIDGKIDNPLFTEAFDNLSRWTTTNTPNIPTKFLPSVGIYLHLQEKKGEIDDLARYLVTKLEEIMSHEIDRFSPLNDPSFVLPIVLGIGGALSDQTRNLLLDVCEKNGKNGKAFRRALFLASAEELNNELKPVFGKPDNYSNPEDMIAVLWLGERYRLSDIDTTGLWLSYGNVKELVSTDELLELGARAYYLSNIDLALLYEAIAQQTAKPDPRILFNIYPIHERIRQVSRSLFEKGEYSASVFEATKVLDTVIREGTGLESTGRPLMQEAMRPKEPYIKFNRLETRSEKDEQDGLKSIAEGIMAAFRNPKGHEPKDTEWGDINPYDALDQIITISTLMKRIDLAIVHKKIL
jgi:uncharacterized protein (TIGR02391 family)